jgi:hypothetical protein
MDGSYGMGGIVEIEIEKNEIERLMSGYDDFVCS